jgi:uncharacterized protein YjbI with pentapeptide repeats
VLETLPQVDILDKQTFTDLVFLDISNSILTECNFENCKFTNTNLSRIEIINCSFTNCEFNNVNFHKGEFLNSTLDSCVFNNCTLTRTEFDRTSENRDDCLIIKSQFFDCQLGGNTFVGGKLQDTTFVNSSLRNISFMNFELIHPKFIKTIIENCDGLTTTLILFDQATSIDQTIYLDDCTDIAPFIKFVNEPENEDN